MTVKTYVPPVLHQVFSDIECSCGQTDCTFIKRVEEIKDEVTITFSKLEIECLSKVIVLSIQSGESHRVMKTAEQDFALIKAVVKIKQHTKG